MSSERIIIPQDSHKGFVYVREKEIALKINHDQKGFVPPKMEEYLRNLQEQSNFNFANLILVAKNALFFMQGSTHMALRKETLKVFGKKSIQNWEIEIEKIVDAHLCSLENCSTVDVVRQYTTPIFTEITQQILGIHPIDKDKFDFWTQQLQVLLQPLLPIRELLRMEDAFSDIIAQVKNVPIDNKISATLPATLLEVLKNSNLVDFTEDDAIATTIVVYGAAINLSQTLANIIWHILSGPPEIKTKAKDKEWVISNMEYLIKIGASPKYIHAISATDQQIEHKSFKKGDNVLLDLLEIHDVGCPFSKQNLWDRDAISKQDHMAFGTGIHFCIGAFLTRIVIEKSIPVLFSKFPDMEIIEKVPQLTSNNQTIIIKSLPVNI